MADVAMDVDEIQVDVGSSSAAAKSSGGKKDKSSLPWVEKYRPDSLDELIAHEDIIKILNQLIESNKLPHLLFYGPPGTGTLPHPRIFASPLRRPSHTVVQHL